MTKRSQNRALYICIILMLITGSIFISVAFGAGKRSSPAEIDESESIPAVTTVKKEETPFATVPEKNHETESKRETKTTETAPKESSPVSLTVDDIAFFPPVDGEVIVSCSLTVPVYSHTMNDYRTHMGVDIAAALGDSVLSCADGTVESVYDDPMMGVTVVVSHAEGIKSIYKGLSAELPEGLAAGVPVNAGDVIGAIGDTALIECEEEPHLHLELQVNGETVDPCEYIEMVSISDVYED